MIQLRNIASNFHEVIMGEAVIYFSYETPIAFRTADGNLWISENEWSVTTGKHLNSISRTAIRVPHKMVLEKIDEHVSVVA